MTRAEFIDNIEDFYDLKEFCEENGMDDILDDIYSIESVDDLFNCRLREGHWTDWRDARSDLADFEDGYDWYREDGYGNLEPLRDGDFDDIKDEVLECGDREGVWDEEEDEEDEEVEIDPVFGNLPDVDLSEWQSVLQPAV